MFNAFVSTLAVAFHTTHGQNKARGFDTEGSCQLPVFVVYLVHCPALTSVLLLEQVICDQSCTSMQNVYIRQKLVRAP